jgi:hypothetical protein
MMLPIRQQLNKLGSLNRTQRVILIEICELAENGGYGVCTASNEHFMERIVTSDRTTSRTLGELERAGLIQSNGATNRRQLRPTPLAKMCYVGTASEVLAAVVQVDRELAEARTPVLAVAANGEIITTTTAKTTAIRGTTTAIRGTTTAIRGSELPPSVVSTTAISGNPYKETSNDEQKDEQELLSSRVAQLEAELSEALAHLDAATAATSEKNRQLLEVKVGFQARLQASEEALADGRKRGRELYQKNQATIAAQAEEITALKAKLAKPKPAASPAKVAEYGQRQGVIDCYFAWYQARNHQIKPVIQAQDAAAALKIFQHFRRQDEAQSDQDAFNAFEMLLSRWDTVEVFLQKQQTLCQIHNNLTNLITQIAHGQPTSNRAQQLGLVDTSKYAAAAARRKELGLD